MPKLIPRLIDIQTIIPAPHWCLHQDISDDPNPDFIDSINRCGLFRPVIVKETPDGNELICGTKRFMAITQLADFEKVPAFIVDQEIQDHEMLALAAEDQNDSAPLSPIETARLIALSDQCDPPLSKEILHSITGITNETQRQQLLTLLKLEIPIRTSIHRGSISVKNGLILAILTTTDRIFLFHLFNRLSLNSNKQHRLMELSRIISVAEQCPISEIFTSNYPAICSKMIDNIPQVTKKLMKNLYQQSHPRISQAKKHYQEQVAKLDLPKNCSLLPSSSFEQDTVRLEVEFENIDDFSQTWKNLKKHLE